MLQGRCRTWTILARARGSRSSGALNRERYVRLRLPRRLGTYPQGPQDFGAEPAEAARGSDDAVVAPYHCLPLKCSRIFP